MILSPKIETALNNLQVVLQEEGFELHEIIVDELDIKMTEVEFVTIVKTLV